MRSESQIPNEQDKKTNIVPADILYSAMQAELRRIAEEYKKEGLDPEQRSDYVELKQKLDVENPGYDIYALETLEKILERMKIDIETRIDQFNLYRGVYDDFTSGQRGHKEFEIKT